MKDPYNLQRFLDAQQPVMEQVAAELKAGRKRSHWMWFVFPQIKGLGHSQLARKFAISSLAEADAYLAHPILGVRLKDCTRLVNAVQGSSAEQIFGYPDDMKFRSCMTLFAAVPFADLVFSVALQQYFDGDADPATLERLAP